MAAVSPPTTIVNGTVLTPWQTLPGATVAVDGSRIVAIGPSPEPLSGIVVDAAGRYVVPGFIDVHSHGALRLVAEDDPAGLAEFHARFGTTAILPTPLPGPLPGESGNGARIVDRFKAAMAGVPRGARVLGMHLEGPYLNPAYGAQRPEDTRQPLPAHYEPLLAAVGSILKMMTVAPELPGALQLIAALRRNGTVVAIGHSAADAATIDRAILAGATHATHIFNAMGTSFRSPSRGVRDVTVAEEILLRDALTADVMADLGGLHVHPSLWKLLVRCKGIGNLAVITDSVPGTGLPPGRHRLPDGRHITIAGDDVARLDDGSFCGSVLTMNAAIRNARRLAGLTLPEAVQLATSNPARFIGIDGRKGSLAPGKDADLVIVDDNLDVWLTMVEGRIVYERGASQ